MPHSYGTGFAVEAEPIRSAATARVYGPEGDFLAISSVASNGVVRPIKVLKPHT